MGIFDGDEEVEEVEEEFEELVSEEYNNIIGTSAYHNGIKIPQDQLKKNIRE